MSSDNTKHYKTGDIGTSLSIVVLSKTTRRPVDLTSASATFDLILVGDSGNVSILDSAVADVDTATSIVSYTWESSDLSAAGQYLACFSITYSNGSKETFPKKGYIEIEVDSAL